MTRLGPTTRTFEALAHPSTRATLSYPGYRWTSIEVMVAPYIAVEELLAPRH